MTSVDKSYAMSESPTCELIQRAAAAAVAAVTVLGAGSTASGSRLDGPARYQHVHHHPSHNTTPKENHTQIIKKEGKERERLIQQRSKQQRPNDFKLTVTGTASLGIVELYFPHETSDQSDVLRSTFSTRHWHYRRRLIECVIMSLITLSLLTYTVYRPPCPWNDEPRRWWHR